MTFENIEIHKSGDCRNELTADVLGVLQAIHCGCNGIVKKPRKSSPARPLWMCLR
jgi:hypothetical protein